MSAGHKPHSMVELEKFAEWGGPDSTYAWALQRIGSLEEQLETQRALLEDIYAWGATVAAEEGSYIFELFERIRPLVVPNPASVPENEA